MDKIINELELVINKELYQENIIDFEEFKYINNKILENNKEKKYEYIKSTK